MSVIARIIGDAFQPNSIEDGKYISLDYICAWFEVGAYDLQRTTDTCDMIKHKRAVYVKHNVVMRCVFMSRSPGAQMIAKILARHADGGSPIPTVDEQKIIDTLQVGLNIKTIDQEESDLDRSPLRRYANTFDQDAANMLIKSVEAENAKLRGDTDHIYIRQVLKHQKQLLVLVSESINNEANPPSENAIIFVRIETKLKPGYIVLERIPVRAMTMCKVVKATLEKHRETYIAQGRDPPRYTYPVTIQQVREAGRATWN